MINKNTRQSCLSTVSISYTPTPLQIERPRQVNSLVPELDPPPEQVFNDNNLKLSHEQSQPIKQSALTRLRINIHRRAKKLFYKSSLNNAEQSLHRHGNQTATQTKQSQQPRQNKTSLNRRKLISLDTNFSKCKTYSSEKNQSRQYLKRQFKQNNQTDVGEQPMFQLSQPEPKRLGKTVQFHQQLSTIIDQSAIAIIPSRKGRHLSNLTKQNKGQLKKVQFDVRRLKSQSRALKKKQNSRVRINIDNEEERKAAYEAWDNVDVFSSNKNGIVEYTRKAVEPTTVTQTDSEWKKKRRTLVEE